METQQYVNYDDKFKKYANIKYVTTDIKGKQVQSVDVSICNINNHFANENNLKNKIYCQDK